MEIPVVFSTDDNYVYQCGVAITSLKIHAAADDNIYIYIYSRRG